MIGEFVKLRREWTAQRPGTKEFHRVPPGTIMLVYGRSGRLLSGTVAHGSCRGYDVTAVNESEVDLTTAQEVIARRFEEN